MIFTYWTGPGGDNLPSTATWGARFPHYRIYGDTDVLPLLEPKFRDLYTRIALPACKSDVARLVLLREYGGLYVDAHTGPADGDRLAETLARLMQYELLLFTRTWECKSPQELHLMNGVIGARRGSQLLTAILDRIQYLLSNHMRAEESSHEHIPYGLSALSGTCALMDCFFDYSINPNPIRLEFQGRIHMDKMAEPGCSGFKVYQFYGYREPGQHWSERQKVERLFLEATP